MDELSIKTTQFQHVYFNPVKRKWSEIERVFRGSVSFRSEQREPLFLIGTLLKVIHLENKLDEMKM